MMTMERYVVAVKQLPETLDVKQERNFVRELETCMKADRPRIVLDCSNLRQLDRSGVRLLLSCLEEAMKRNGDVKLAAVPAEAAAVLALTGAGRLFEMFGTAAGAVDSFHHLLQLPADPVSPALVSGLSHHGPESVA